jgi:hypothetical protein
MPTDAVSKIALADDTTAEPSPVKVPNRSVENDEAALAFRYDDTFEDCFERAVQVYGLIQAETHGISLEAGRWRASHFLAWIKYPDREDRMGYVQRSLENLKKDRRNMIRRRRSSRGGLPHRQQNMRPEVRCVVPRARESRPRRSRASSGASRDGPSSSDDDPDDADRLGRSRGRLGVVPGRARR